MKKAAQLFYLIIIYIISSSAVYSQIKINIYSIISNSVNYNFDGPGYVPFNYTQNYNALGDMLAIRSARYNEAHSICSTEYSKLEKLELLNTYNIQILKSYQSQVKNWADRNYSKVDLSIEENKNSVLDYITAVYKVKSISDEIKILQEIDSYSNNIPYYSTVVSCQNSRYNELNEFIEEFKNYGPEKLSNGFNSLFNDFYSKRNNETMQKSETFKNQVEFEYRKIVKFKNIPNGWHNFKGVSINKMDLGNILSHRTLESKVYVQNNKIVSYIKKDGTSVNINSSDFIRNQKVDVFIEGKNCSDGSFITVPYVFYILE